LAVCCCVKRRYYVGAAPQEIAGDCGRLWKITGDYRRLQKIIEDYIWTATGTVRRSFSSIPPSCVGQTYCVTSKYITTASYFCVF